MRDGSSDGLTRPPICEPSLSIVSSLGGGREESPDELHTVVVIMPTIVISHVAICYVHVPEAVKTPYFMQEFR